MAHFSSRSFRRFIRTAILLAIILNLSVIWEVFSKGNKELYAEGGFIESLTACSFLCGAVILFASSFFKGGLTQFLTIFLATINLTAFLREVDVAEYNVPSPLLELGSNNLKDGLLTIIFIIIIFIGLKRHRHQVRDIWREFQSPMGYLLLLGGLFFIVSIVVEQLDSPFAEELLELNAAMAFLCGSLLLGLQEPKVLSEPVQDSTGDTLD